MTESLIGVEKLAVAVCLILNSHLAYYIVRNVSNTMDDALFCG